jgi:hypothetical protein
MASAIDVIPLEFAGKSHPGTFSEETSIKKTQLQSPAWSGNDRTSGIAVFEIESTDIGAQLIILVKLLKLQINLGLPNYQRFAMGFAVMKPRRPISRNDIQRARFS